MIPKKSSAKLCRCQIQTLTTLWTYVPDWEENMSSHEMQNLTTHPGTTLMSFTMNSLKI